jgi:RecA-family ATPase
MTVTGNIVEGFTNEIRSRQKEIEEIIKKEFGEIQTANPKGWETEAIKELQPGNICNTTIKLVGKFHRQGLSKEDIYTTLRPHIERAGGNEEAFRSRIEAITAKPRYGTQDPITIDDDVEDLETFLSNIQKLKWIVPNIIPENSITFLYGLQETCKTWLLMDLAIAMAKGGGYWTGKFPVESGTVLYIDQERSRTETQRRFRALCAAQNLKFKDLTLQVKWGSTIRLNLQHSFEGFKRLLEKVNPKLICVDSFATFHTSEENNKKDIQAVFEKLKDLRNTFNCTFVFVDHENKFGYTSEQIENPTLATLSGSSGKAAVLESAILVQKIKDGVSKVCMTKNTQGLKVDPFTVQIEDLEPDRSKISVKGY